MDKAMSWKSGILIPLLNACRLLNIVDDRILVRKRSITSRGYILVAKITSKGQVTIPKVIRNRLGLTYGDEVDFKIVHDEIVLAPIDKHLDIDDIKGILSTREKVTDEQIRTARSRALEKKFSEK